MEDERYATFVCLLLAIVVTAIAWGAVPWGTFQFDDFRNIVRDPATTDAAALLERLPHGLRPLTRLSYFLDAQLYRTDGRRLPLDEPLLACDHSAVGVCTGTPSARPRRRIDCGAGVCGAARER